jgi:hypothetical protein
MQEYLNVFPLETLTSFTKALETFVDTMLENSPNITLFIPEIILINCVPAYNYGMILRDQEEKINFNNLKKTLIEFHEEKLSIIELMLQISQFYDAIHTNSIAKTKLFEEVLLGIRDLIKKFEELFKTKLPDGMTTDAADKYYRAVLAKTKTMEDKSLNELLQKIAKYRCKLKILDNLVEQLPAAKYEFSNIVNNMCNFTCELVYKQLMTMRSTKKLENNHFSRNTL